MNGMENGGRKFFPFYYPFSLSPLGKWNPSRVWYLQAPYSAPSSKSDVFPSNGMGDQFTSAQLFPVSIWYKSKKGQAIVFVQVKFQRLHCPRRQRNEGNLLLQSQIRLTRSLPKDLTSQCVIVFLLHLPVKAKIGNECGTMVWKCGTVDEAQKWMKTWNGFLVL